jgi:hypothetical protein
MMTSPQKLQKQEELVEISTIHQEIGAFPSFHAYGGPKPRKVIVGTPKSEKLRKMMTSPKKLQEQKELVEVSTIHQWIR